MADRTRPTSASVHGRRRLGDRADPGDGDRQLRRQRRRLSRCLPHEPGTERPPVAAGWPIEADLQGPVRPARTDGDAAVDRRGPAAVHRLAPRVRRCQQRRVHRPVRLEGQRRSAGRLRDKGPVRPVPRAAGRQLRPGRRGRRHRRFRPRPRGGPGRPQPRRPARPGRGVLRRPGQAVAERRCDRINTRLNGERPLARRQAGSAGAECRRDRVLGRSPGRRNDRPARGHDRRWPHQRRARVAALRARPGRLGRRSGHVAGRDGRAVAARHGRPVPDLRSSVGPGPTVDTDQDERSRTIADAARLAAIDLPDFGMPDREPG